MPPKTPSFWYRSLSSPAPLQELACGFLSPIYSLARKISTGMKNSYKSKIPVICIGNAVAGGSGKTPTAIALKNIILKNSILKDPVFLTRGYGGSVQKPELVNADEHSANDVGDEGLLLAVQGQTIVAKDRVNGAKMAEDMKHDGIILDDGLQNPSLLKDLSFLVIDGASGFGNQKTLPAGPLREPLHESFLKSDAFILIGKDKNNVTALLPENKPLFLAHVKVSQDQLPENKNVVAFAGLGRPEKFYHTLIDHDYTVASWHPFPDHYTYSEEDIETLIKESAKHNAQLATTEKDFVKISHMKGVEHIAHIPITIEFEHEISLVSFLQEKLA